MFQSLESFIALRYLRPRKGQLFVSLISFASVIGITLCVASLITITSVMNGFGNDLRERLVSLTSHITVTAGRDGLANWQPLAERLARRARVAGAAPFVEGQGMVVLGGSLNGTVVSGVVPELERQVSDLHASLIEGNIDDLQAGSGNIVIGSHLAYTIGAGVGDKLTLMIPRPTGDGTGVLPLLRRFTVSGVFDAGVQTETTARSVIHLDDAIELFDLLGPSGVHLKTDDMMAARDIAERLSRELESEEQTSDLRVVDWTRQQSSFFRALRIEKVMMSLFLLLAVGVAAFNINAMLMMVVSEKRTDIAVLRTFGMSPQRVTRIFLTQGTIIAVVGVLAGVAIGVLLALNVETIAPAIEQLVGRKLFRADVFYVSDIPSDMRWSEVAVIALLSLALAVSSTLYPSRRAAAIEPAEALRYE